MMITMEMNDRPLQRYSVKVVRDRNGQRMLIVVRERSVTGLCRRRALSAGRDGLAYYQNSGAKF